MPMLTRLGAVLLLGIPFMSTSAQAKNWKDSLEAELRRSIKVTKVGTDAMRITDPGTVFVIQKEGLSGDLSSDFTSLLNHVTPEGNVRQAKGLAAALGSKESNRDFAVGDRVYVRQLDVRNNEVDVLVVSQETFPITRNGSTKQTRYKSAIRFDFPKDSLARAGAAAVLARIEAVLQPVNAPSAEPKTVELGQTVAQVEAVLGKPDKVIKLGAKTIYVYKDLKVTFTDGKVTDVQ